MLEPKRRGGKRGRQAEEYRQRERPPDADGESYRAEYAAVGKAHYRGKRRSVLSQWPLGQGCEVETAGLDHLGVGEVQCLSSRCRREAQAPRQRRTINAVKRA
jgi:hypothetical protein